MKKHILFIIMKKHILFIMACLMTVSSCDDFLERVPIDFVSPDNYLTNENQAEKLLNGVYAQLKPNIGEEGLFPIHLATCTDDAFDSQPWHATTEWARGQGNPRSFWASAKWSTDYTGIARANVFINSIQKADFSSKLFPRYLGEAKFLRAYYYHDLVTFYGDVPLVLEPGDLDNSKPKRTPKAEVVAQILADLEDAIKVLPLDYPADEVGRITKGAAMGLKARVLLYEGEWDKAAQAAKDVIDLKQYRLFPDYQGVFLEKNELASVCEIMLKRCFTPIVDPSRIYFHIGEWPDFAPTKQLVDSYYMKDGLPITKSPMYDPANPHMNRDPRFNASIFYPGCKNLNYRQKSPDPEISKDSVTISQWLLKESGYRCKKYFDGTIMQEQDEGEDMSLMRYAEILLTYAEALNEAQGPTPEVYAAIDQLRDRVHTTRLSVAMPGLTKEQMRQEIRNERRVELAFEGRRWADIRRWKIGEEVMVNAIGLDHTKMIDGCYPGDGKGETPDWQYVEKIIDYRQFNPNRDYLWPIPQGEIDANENIVQNPGY